MPKRIKPSFAEAENHHEPDPGRGRSGGLDLKQERDPKMLQKTKKTQLARTIAETERHLEKLRQYSADLDALINALDHPNVSPRDRKRLKAHILRMAC
jgi:hypothetical protein